jgi:hypothetical protein
VRALVATALALKAEVPGAADPTRWSPEDLTTVLTRTFPARVPLDADEQRLVGPAMALYLSFLGTTGRWPASAVPLDALTGLVEELTDEVPRAYGRGSGHDGVEHAPGAEPEHAPGAEPTPETAPGAEPTPEPNPFTALWPDALGPVPDLAVVLRLDVPTDRAAAWMRGSRVWGWTRGVLNWVGTSREVADDGGLRDADAAELLGRLAPAGDPAPIALLWPALVATGLLEVTGDRARPGPRALGQGPDEAVVLDGVALHAAVLAELLRPAPSGTTRARVPGLTLGALVRAADPRGFTVPAGLGPALADVTEGLGADLAVAVQVGVLERRGDAYVLPSEVAPAVPYAVGLVGP